MLLDALSWSKENLQGFSASRGICPGQLCS
jgi:hypothetical protein